LYARPLGGATCMHYPQRQLKGYLLNMEFSPLRKVIMLNNGLLKDLHLRAQLVKYLQEPWLRRLTDEEMQMHLEKVRKKEKSEAVEKS